MNNELVQTRSLIKKYSHFYHQEKLTSHNLKEKIKELEDNIKKLNNGILPNKKEANINIIDCLFSDDDDDDFLDDDYDNKKEDDDIQFPDKFNNLVKTSENNSNIPKLDLSQVLSKYKKLENIKVIENKNKKSHRSGDGEVIEKLNAQIKIFKQTIQRYKDRIKNLREQLSILRNRNKILENTLQNNYHNKFTNNNNNVYMNVNVSRIGDNFNYQKDNNNKNESENKLNN
jgi:ribosomal protein L19E